MISYFPGRADVAVPRVYWDYSTSRVLVMEFINGCKVNDLDALEGMGISPSHVSRAVSQLFSDMIFLNGFFHGSYYHIYFNSTISWHAVMNPF